MVDGDRNPVRERTAIMFAPPAGMTLVHYPGTIEDAQRAVNSALQGGRAWLRIPTIDGAPPLLIAPYAVRHISMIATVFLPLDDADQEQPNGHDRVPLVIARG